MQSALPGVSRLDGIQLACGESQVRHDGPGLLAQPDLVEALDVVAGAQRCRGEYLIHRDDAGTADSGEEDVVGGGDRLDVEVGQTPEARAPDGVRGFLPRLAPRR